ncbi:MAG: DUF2029 domain-containing protein [Candidatus Eisenbacteria bacterium]|uniref:DUF2029 domain-containing protein n=1 Tax=Eiseniibacteriota bacterium TaxID=2212470 RepID=A0A933SBJ9_UNCEI|nr:DUF2029 domain-containing protein [Candidatus Eisenbacteria bacterium]
MTRTATLSPGRSLAEGVAVAMLAVAASVAMGRLPSWTAQLGALQSLAWGASAVLALALIRLARWRVTRDVALVVVTAVAMRLAVLPRIPELSDDLWRYVWDGRVVLAGLDPYAHAPDAPALAAMRETEVHPRINHPSLRTIYPPFAEAGFALAERVHPGWLGMKGWIALNDVALVWVLAVLSRRRCGSALPAIAYAWNPLVVIEYAGSGHHDPTALLPLALAVLLLESRPKWSAACFAAAVLGKLLPLAALPLFWRRWPAGARAIAVVASGAGLAWFLRAASGEASGLEAYARTWRNNALAFEGVERVLGEPVARAVAITAPFVVATVAAARGAELVRGARAAFRAGLLLGPVLHPWYLGWALVWDGVAPSLPWLLLSALALLNYGVLAAPAEGGAFHLSLPWRIVEYGAPALLALALHRTRKAVHE